MHNFSRECRSNWYKNFLPNVRFIATAPHESLRHKSSTFYAVQVLTLCTRLYRSNLQKPVSTKVQNEQNTPESGRFKLYV